METTTEEQWQGRLAVVTGAASGIGRATATALAARGCRVIAADVDPNGLERLTETLRGQPGRLTTAVMDVSRWQEVADVTTTILAESGAPDFLVANAGINPPAPSTGAIDEALWDRIIDVNLKGIFATNRALLPAMSAAGRGSVVNLASVSGLIGWGGTSAYSASKGGVIALTKYLAMEFAPRVRVNCVCPGSVRTPMVLNNLRRFGDPEERLAETAGIHLLRRVAEPEEIADAILFLLSDRAAFITGSALTVDGGLTAV
ncbi:MAG TPA: SDR family NAD(P)-dependent oxidoreductase [Thermomicrobiaceae bacterium]|nr:SDR family NAD(P)-dependent oxidoreductase [Thermomicrobiaceae bacterium]